MGMRIVVLYNAENNRWQKIIKNEVGHRVLKETDRKRPVCMKEAGKQ